MSSEALSPSAEFVRLTHVASEAGDLGTLVSAQHQLRAEIRRAVTLQQWSDLDEAESAVTGSPPLAARFKESLHHALETPEFLAGEPAAHWHGLVLAIPVALASREGSLGSLPHPLASAMRESLQERFPGRTGVRLLNRLIPQLVVHSMRTQSLYELVEELASGERGAPPDSGSQPTSDFVPHGRSLGLHHLFALAFTASPEEFALELPRDLKTDPGLVKWAAGQTEAISSFVAERGWQLLVRVSAPQRLSEMLSMPPLLSDVREVDDLLDHVASRYEIPIPMLHADLRLGHAGEPGVHITISDRRVGVPLARGFNRFAALGAEAGAYRLAVRLASAGVELSAAEDSVQRSVDRALALMTPTAAAEATTSQKALGWRPFGNKRLWSRFSRSSRHPH